MHQFELKKRTYIGLADATFRLYRRYFGLFFKITAVFFILPLVVQKILEFRYGIPMSVWSYIGWMFSTSVIGDYREYPFEQAGAEFEYCCVAWIVAILHSGLTALSAAPLIKATSDIAIGKESGFRAAFRIRWNIYGRVVMATIGYFLVLSILIFGANMAMMFIMMAGANTVDNMAPGPAESVCLGACGCVVFTIPYILVGYVAILMSLYMPAIVLEGSLSRRSVYRSMALVKGSWWFSFRVLVGVLLIQALVLMGSESAFQMLYGLLISWSARLEVLGQAIYAGGSTLVNIFIRPVVFIALTLLFYELKVRREAYDLELMIKDF
jgi:hypothetical protein